MSIFKSKKVKDLELRLEKECKRSRGLEKTCEELAQERDMLYNEVAYFKEELTKSLANYIEEAEVDINKFMTTTYQDRFHTALLQNSFSDVELKDKYNLLLNQERMYLEACIDILNYCKYDKNRSTSIEKQLEKKFLTDIGLKYVNYVREMNDNNE